jgi:hypothetical protein
MLFGSLFVWSVLARLSYRQRPAPVISRSPKLVYDILAAAAGLTLYALILGAWHQRLFGVAPLG